MAVATEDFVVIAEDGTRVTGEMVDAWEEAYSAGRLPDGFVSGERHAGRPKLYEGDMATMTVRLPQREKDRLTREAKRRGMSLSGYVRDLIEASAK